MIKRITEFSETRIAQGRVLSTEIPYDAAGYTRIEVDFRDPMNSGRFRNVQSLEFYSELHTIVIKDKSTRMFRIIPAGHNVSIPFPSEHGLLNLTDYQGNPITDNIFLTLKDYSDESYNLKVI